MSLRPMQSLNEVTMLLAAASLIAAPSPTEKKSRTTQSAPHECLIALYDAGVTLTWKDYRPKGRARQGDDARDRRVHPSLPDPRATQLWGPALADHDHDAALAGAMLAQSPITAVLAAIGWLHITAGGGGWKRVDPRSQIRVAPPFTSMQQPPRRPSAPAPHRN